MAQAPLDNYPFSTKDGKVIPLDIIRPKSLIVKSFSAVDSTIVLPVGLTVCTLLATEDCFLFLGAVPLSVVSGDINLEALFIPKNMVITTALDGGTVTIRGVNVGTLYMQFIEQWAGLSLDINYTKR